jgi:hypothetical protein
VLVHDLMLHAGFVRPKPVTPGSIAW